MCWYGQDRETVELLQDGALTKEEAVVVIDHLDVLIDDVRQTTDVWWLRIVLDGLRVSLEEMKRGVEY